MNMTLLVDYVIAKLVIKKLIIFQTILKKVNCGTLLNLKKNGSINR